MILDTFDNTEVIEAKTLDTKRDTTQPSIIDVDGDWITFGNIKCYGADGNVFESYRRVQLARDVLYKENSPLQSASSLASALSDALSSGCFLPSCALTLSCIVTLYELGEEQLYREAISKKAFRSHLPLMQNSSVDWENRCIIHYPNGREVGEYWDSKGVNTPEQRISFSFNRESLHSAGCDQIMGDPEYTAFAQNLTGLRDITVLNEIVDCMGSTTQFWIPTWPNVKKGTVAIGEAGRSFFVNTYNTKSNTVRAARIPQ